MKRIGSVCIAIAFVFLLSNVASATNWVLVLKLAGWGDDTPPSSVYIDADSVVRSGDTFSFWMLQVYDAPVAILQNEKNELWKVEAKLTDPVQHREVEYYRYDDAGKELVARPDFY